mgnify:CR=1 FL=1
MEQYPETATEIFDNANFHIKYCLSIINKYIKGDVIEIGAGCGSFTRNYFRPDLKNIVLTEKDLNNIQSLKNNFKKYTNIKVMHTSINHVEGRFDSILYFHVLEHIENDLKEIEMAKKKLNVGGHLIIMVPAHQKIYGNLDKAVGHFRRYEKDFFKVAKEFVDITTITLDGTSDFIDSVTYKEHTGVEPIYKENTELLDEKSMKILDTWHDYSIY